MSKDTINPKRWILDEKQIEKLVLENFNRGKEAEKGVSVVSTYLPFEPVEIPSDEEIDKTLPNSGQVPMQDGCSYNETCANNTQRRIGAKWLKHLIFNKQ